MQSPFVQYHAAVSKKHALFKEFSHELKEAVFGPDALRTKDTVIPSPELLERRLQAWFDKYRVKEGASTSATGTN